jgi:hypothetical protein
MAAKTSPRQRKTIGRVMHEYKHGELKRSKGGKGARVKSRRQAIAIALDEAGASNEQSASENRKTFRRTKRKERRGETAQQEREGRSHIGAEGRKRKSSSKRKSSAAKSGNRRKSGARKASKRKSRGKRKS